MAVISTSLEELVDYPIAHFSVVGRDSYECGFNEISFDRNQGGQKVEGVLNLIDSLLLVGNYFQDA
jgi:hypothetical protein